ncbi:hypothetical protein [Caldimonas sp. KR1-144]|uniref:hypothetical protein n=1 Tax=Caldimonas sp. KR1-144 TaxID=3400911 RepID=UPI003C01FDFD
MPTRLKLVPPTEEPAATKVRRRVAAQPKPASMIQCRRCGGREVIEVKSGVLFQAGKTKGGTRQLACYLCMMRGERVILA